MKMDVISIFEVPLLCARLDLDVSSIEQYCWDYSRKNVGRQSSNAGGYQSNNLPKEDTPLTGLVQEIEKVKLPYNVNLISLIAAKRIIQEQALIEERSAFIYSERQRVFDRLEAISGIRPYPSYANFILFEVDRSVHAIFQGLIEQGVLIRDVSRYPMLDKAMRVTIGTREENEAFLEALREVVRIVE